MSQVICWALSGRPDLGGGQYHWYKKKGFMAHCMYCGALKTLASLTPKWKEYEE